MFVLCVLSKIQDNQDKETSTDETQTEYKRIQKKCPGRGEILRSHPYALGTLSLLYNRFRVSSPGVSGRGINHPLPSSAEVKERVELYLYSPSVSSCPVLERTFYVLYFIMTKFCDSLISFSTLIWYCLVKTWLNNRHFTRIPNSVFSLTLCLVFAIDTLFSVTYDMSLNKLLNLVH